MISFSGSRIIPAPLATFGKSYQTTDDGTRVGTTFNITLTGKLVSHKGSPRSGLRTVGGSSWAGNFWTDNDNYPPDEGLATVDDHFQSILRKQEHLRSLFSYEGAPLIIRAYDSGNVNLKCNPRVKSVNFQEGIWVHQCDYSIELEADVLYSDKMSISGEDPNLYPYVSEANEDWQIEKNDDNQSYRLTHSVSAKGKRFYDSGGLPREAWENARLYVLPKLGLNQERIINSGVMNLFNYSGFDYVRSQNLNQLGGTFAVTESWVVTSGAAAIETFNVSTRDSSEDGLIHVTVEGEVRGLESRNNTDYTLQRTKYQNAEAKYNTISNDIHSRAQVYSGTTLNPSTISNTVGRNPWTGIISYNFEYSNRYIATTNALSEVVTVTDVNQKDIFARIGILGSSKGEVLQSISSGVPERLLNIEIVVRPRVYGGAAISKPDVKQIVIDNTPVGYSKLMKEQDEENFSQSLGRFSKVIRWVYRM